MSSRALRNILGTILMVLVAALISDRRVWAGCPNPRLSYTETITGPEEDCEDQVTEDTDADCPGLCNICGRNYDGDYETENNVCELGADGKSRSGWIQCNCVEPI